MKKTILTIIALPMLGLGIAVAKNPAPDADNSARNERDRSSTAVTPFDQSNDKADLEVVQTIRKALIADDTLSVNAKNVKVITDSKRIALRGPVKSKQEKTIIEKLAKDNAAGRTVDSQLEIETQH